MNESQPSSDIPSCADSNSESNVHSSYAYSNQNPFSSPASLALLFRQPLFEVLPIFGKISRMINQRRVKQKLFNVKHFRLLSRTHHCILVILQMVAHHLPYVGQCLYDHP